MLDLDQVIADALAAVHRRAPAEHRAIVAELAAGARLRIVVDPPVDPAGRTRIRVRLLRLEGRNRWVFKTWRALAED